MHAILIKRCGSYTSLAVAVAPAKTHLRIFSNGIVELCSEILSPRKGTSSFSTSSLPDILIRVTTAFSAQRDFERTN